MHRPGRCYNIYIYFLGYIVSYLLSRPGFTYNPTGTISIPFIIPTGFVALSESESAETELRLIRHMWWPTNHSLYLNCLVWKLSTNLMRTVLTRTLMNISTKSTCDEIEDGLSFACDHMNTKCSKTLGWCVWRGGGISVDMHAFQQKNRRENHRRVVFTQQDTIYSRAHLVLTNLLITSLSVLCFSQWFFCFCLQNFFWFLVVL